MTRCLLVLLLALGWLTAAPATAQLRAGVALDAALPAGATLLDVRAPDSDRGAVRLRLSADGRAPSAIVDVWVRGTEAEAVAVWEAQARTAASSVLGARGGLGDAAVADALAGLAGIVVMRRDNVVVRVLTIDQEADAAAIALGFDQAILTSGGPRTTLDAPDVQGRGGGFEIARGAALDVAVVPEDGAIARRTETGWSVTGHGTLVWVDRALRVGTRTF